MIADKKYPSNLVVRLFSGGLVATLLLTLMMYKGAPMMTGKAMDIAGELGAMMALSWTMGMTAHFVLGALIFPAAYVLLVRPRLTGPAFIRGTVWGLMLWAVAMLVMSPMMGNGLFMGAVPAALASLMGHIVYGGVLGVSIGSNEPGEYPKST